MVKDVVVETGCGGNRIGFRLLGKGLATLPDDDVVVGHLFRGRGWLTLPDDVGTSFPGKGLANPSR